MLPVEMLQYCFMFAGQEERYVRLCSPLPCVDPAMGQAAQPRDREGAHYRSGMLHSQVGANQPLQILQSSPLFAPVVSSKAGTEQQTCHLVSVGIAQLKENRKEPTGTEPSL